MVVVVVVDQSVNTAVHTHCKQMCTFWTRRQYLLKLCYFLPLLLLQLFVFRQGEAKASGFTRVLLVFPEGEGNRRRGFSRTLTEFLTPRRIAIICNEIPITDTI
jgi:hypothetical protein